MLRLAKALSIPLTAVSILLCGGCGGTHRCHHITFANDDGLDIIFSVRIGDRPHRLEQEIAVAATKAEILEFYRDRNANVNRGCSEDGDEISEDPDRGGDLPLAVEAVDPETGDAVGPEYTEVMAVSDDYAILEVRWDGFEFRAFEGF